MNVFTGSHGDPRSDLRPLRGLDAAGQGEDHRGEPEGADQERHQLRASIPGKLIKHLKTLLTKLVSILTLRSFEHFHFCIGTPMSIAVKPKTLNFQDAKANEVDSGTELDSQGEEEAEEVKEEEIQAVKDDEEKKDD